MAKQQDDETKGDTMLEVLEGKKSQTRSHNGKYLLKCSPVAKIMEDTKDNHNGDKREATTLLLKHWFSQELNMYSMFDCCLRLFNFFLIALNIFHF
jgi:hypothetical protein